MCEPPLVFERNRHVARKAHRCVECRGVIEPGQEYERHDGLWYENWEHHKLCLACVAAMEREFEQDPGFCFVYGELHETIEEVHG